MKYFFLYLLVITGSFLKAQEKVTKLVQQLQTNYNNKEYASIYKLLNSVAKNTITEKELSNFFASDLRPSLGKFNGFKELKHENNTYLFAAYFDEDSLQLNCALGKDNLFEDFNFTPFPPITNAKRSTYLSDNKKTTTLDSVVDKLVKTYMEDTRNCGLSIGIVENDKFIFYNYGETKKGNNQLPTNKTIYEIGSVTKTFCGRLLAIAIQENKISLEDDIRKYLGNEFLKLEYNGNPILVKHLANHSSGLPRAPEDLFTKEGFEVKNPYKNYTNKDLLSYLKTVVLTKNPGEVCEYSNLGMGLLGYILETVYKKSFSELVKEKVTNVIGMKETGITNTMLDKVVMGYNDKGTQTPNWEFASLQAAGAICSNIEEMLLYLKENLKETELNKLLFTPTFTNGNKLSLAWHFLKRKTDAELIWHNGGTGGFASFVGLIKEKNIGFVVLTNSSPQTDALPLSIYNYLKK